MNRLIGILMVVISAAGFGTLGILGRYAYSAGMDAATILCLRFSLAAVLLAVLLVARRERLPRGLPLLRLIAMGAVGYVGQAFSYLTAVRYASPGLVALLLYLYPAFVVLLSAAWRRQPISLGKALALGLALSGVALTVGPQVGQVSGAAAGIVLGLLAAVIYSLYIIVGAQVMRQVAAIPSSTVIFASAGVMSGILMMIRGPHLPATAVGWGVIAAIVLIATVVPVVTFLVGLQRIGAPNAAMLSTLEPVVTLLLSAALLGEALAPIALLGGGLILLAVLLLTITEMRRAGP